MAFKQVSKFLARLIQARILKWLDPDSFCEPIMLKLHLTIFNLLIVQNAWFGQYTFFL